jgi:hypothetical protein
MRKALVQFLKVKEGNFKTLETTISTYDDHFFKRFESSISQK